MTLFINGLICPAEYVEKQKFIRFKYGMKKLFLIFCLFIASAGYSQSQVWLIGTAHEENNYINPDTLINIFNKIEPDLILLELEEKHFTKEFTYDTTKYSLEDFLQSNENIAAYKYQQQHHIQLRPFDINGRHDYYQKEDINNKEKKMFGEMMTLYTSNKLSENSKVDFEILLAALSEYSQLHFSSLKEANSDIAAKFLALKNKINFQLMISVVKQTKKLHHWLKFARLRSDYWDIRNKAMAENIIKYVNEFKGRKVIVMVGNDHRSALLEMMKKKNIVTNNCYEE